MPVIIMNQWKAVTAQLGGGSMWGWGDNQEDQVGSTDADPIRQLDPIENSNGGEDWAQISTGRYHSGALKGDGTIWMWGRGDGGRLGRGPTPITDVSVPTQTVDSNTNWAKLALGQDRTGAIKKDGTLWMWGHNQFGALGDGTTVLKDVPTQEILGDTDWAEISTARYNSAAIKTDGTLWTWGRAFQGILGNNNTTGDVSTPTQAGTDTDWAQISCGTNHMAAIKTDGSLWLWGRFAEGQLGTGIAANALVPTETSLGGTDWAQVSCGSAHTAAVKTDGTLYAWGTNTDGQIGDGTVIKRDTPVQEVTGAANWAKVSCGTDSTLAINTSGTAWGWGANGQGQRGDGTSGTDSSTPIQNSNPTNFWSDITIDGISNFALALANPSLILTPPSYGPEVSLQLALDGTDGATSTVDDSNYNHPVVFNGTAQLDTAQKKNGTSSLLLDGNSDYISVADDPTLDFGGNDYTVECHVRFNGDPGTAQMAFVSKWAAPTQWSYYFGLRNNELVAFDSTVGSDGNAILAEAWNPAGDTWYHIAFCREYDGVGGSDMRVFVDGIQQGTDNPIGVIAVWDSSTDVRIGSFEASPFDYLNGWIDNVIITKGVCKYTGNFTPPA